jgi:hypothetical protein
MNLNHTIAIMDYGQADSAIAAFAVLAADKQGAVDVVPARLCALDGHD